MDRYSAKAESAQWDIPTLPALTFIGLGLVAGTMLGYIIAPTAPSQETGEVGGSTSPSTTVEPQGGRQELLRLGEKLSECEAKLYAEEDRAKERRESDDRLETSFQSFLEESAERRERSLEREKEQREAPKLNISTKRIEEINGDLKVTGEIENPGNPMSGLLTLTLVSRSSGAIGGEATISIRVERGVTPFEHTFFSPPEDIYTMEATFLYEE